MNRTTTWRTSSYSNNTGGNCVEVGYTWRTSSRSNNAGGNCVEVGASPAAPDVVAVRDTKDRTGPVLRSSRDGWTGFISAVAAGALDR